MTSSDFADDVVKIGVFDVFQNLRFKIRLKSDKIRHIAVNDVTLSNFDKNFREYLFY